MFSSEHAIWKFARAGDELEDWLGHAEWLVDEWSSLSSDEVKFQNTFDIILAALMLEDGLLPASARAAFAKLMMDTISEADDKKLGINCLHVKPPKPGRKKDRERSLFQYIEVKNLIQEGKSATEAYKVLADKHCKSTDTIRREYERFNKRRLKK